MYFDPANKIVQLCAKGMELEATEPEVAKLLFMQAWNEAANHLEKFTAAHYIARQQPSIEKKMEWDKTALEYALKINDDSAKQYYPSLYLNIAKCYEDLNDRSKARLNYIEALSYINYLPENEYGEMIKAGIDNGIKRTG